jgi:hypothetical protein
MIYDLTVTGRDRDTIYLYDSDKAGVVILRQGDKLHNDTVTQINFDRADISFHDAIK